MTAKPFDSELYDADDDAKHLVVEWLKARRYNAYINPDQYGIDVLADKYNTLWGFEVEVKHNWKGIQFPFRTVHFAARKLKFANDDTYLTMLNDERTRLLLVHGGTASRSPVVRKDTKYTNGEDFIEIPLHSCIIRAIWRW